MVRRATANGRAQPEQTDPDEHVGRGLDDLPSAEGDPEPEEPDDEDEPDEREEVEEDEPEEEEDEPEDEADNTVGGVTLAVEPVAARIAFTEPSRGDDTPAPRQRAQRAPRARAPRAPRDVHVPGMPRGVQGPRGMTAEQRTNSPALQAVRSFQQQGYQELDEMMGSLNHSQREYKTTIERLEPAEDENGTPCAGELAVYRTRVNTEDVAKRFGGGVYRFSIFGPSPATGVKGIIKRDVFTIAGEPKPMKTQRGSSGDGRSSEMAEVMRTMAEANERNQQRMAELLERTGKTPSPVKELVPIVMPLLEKFFERSEASTAALLESQREDRKEAERQRREDRLADEKRRDEEKKREEKREDQRRADEAKAEDRRLAAEAKAEAQRRDQIAADRDAAKEARDAERDRARDERDRLRDEAKADAAEKQRQHERDLAAQVQRTADDKQRQTEYLAMVAKDRERADDLRQQQIDMMLNKQDTGGIENVSKQLMALKGLSGMLTGSDQEPTKLEAFTESVDSIGKTLLPLAQQLMGGFQGRGKKGGGQQGQPQQQFAPGQQPKPILVELGPVRTALPAPQQMQGMSSGLPQMGQPMHAPQQPQYVQNPQAPVTMPSTMPPAQHVPQHAPQQMQGPVPGQVQTQGPAQDPNALLNDYTAIILPQPGSGLNMLQAGEMLIKDVDFAVQRNYTAQQIVDEILDPFEEHAPLLMKMASGLDAVALIEFVSQNVPDYWAIMSPRGEALVVAAFDLWNQDEEDGPDDQGGDQGGGFSAGMLGGG